jgi:hypothetical protein
MEILSHGDVPVVLVGPSFDPTARPEGAVVQCITEGDSLAPDQLGPRCARHDDLELRVLHVSHDGAGTGSGSELAAATAELATVDVRMTIDDLSAPDVPKAILGVVRSVRPRLLAIRRNRRAGRIDRPFGRVGIELVRSCPCPILVDLAVGERPSHSSIGEDRVAASTSSASPSAT